MAGEQLAASNPYLAGRPCPKCRYVRNAADTNPAWQCPRCHVAYLKFRPGQGAFTQRLVAGSRELAAQGASDRSAYALIGANLFAGAVALMYTMDLKDLMLVYWVQSVIIGICYFIRIVKLQDFSTEGMRAGGRSIAETQATKLKMALIFLFHYGGFHAVYYIFLVYGPATSGNALVPLAGLALCALAFAINHGYSLAHNIRNDRRGTVNLGTLMTLPYARIIPMHVTILAGGAFEPSPRLLLLFIGLKTGADLVMHVVEHHVLRSRASQDGPDRAIPGS
jgi:hypothetical protein